MEPTIPAPDPSPDPDALFARWRSDRDLAALGSLFDATAPELFRVALALAPDAAAAEDVLQETFLAALRGSGRHEPGRPVAPWLVGILRLEAQAARRRARRRPEPGRLAGRVPQPGPAETAERHDEERRALAAVDRLPEPYRGVALLRWRYGLEPGEIAHVRGEPPGTVRSLLSRAVQRMRRGLRHVPALFGLRVPRGLEGVRAAVLRGAGAVPVGAILVETLMKKAAVWLAVPVLALGTWWLVGHRDPAPRAATESRGELAGAATMAPAPERPAVAAGVQPAAASVDPWSPRLRGLVVDTRGEPVPGARVSGYAADIERIVSREEPGSALASARTDASGRFDLPLVAAGPPSVLCAEAVGFGPGLAAGVRPEDEVTIRLDPEAAIAGRVSDLDGRPLPGARVRALAVIDEHWWEREAVAGAQGDYRLDGLPATSVVRLRLSARAAGRAPASPGLPRGWRGTGEGRVDVFLAAGSRLRGRVIDAETGEALPLARVRLTLHEGHDKLTKRARERTPLPAFPVVLEELRSAADGSFTIDRVPARGAFHRLPLTGTPAGQSVCEVHAVLEGRAPGAVDAPFIEEEGTAEVVVRLWPAATIRGRVIDREGKPVANAEIQARPEGGWRQWIETGSNPELVVPLVQTAADGRYEVVVPAPRERVHKLGVDALLGGLVAMRSRGTVRVEARAQEPTLAPDIVMAAPDRPSVRFLVTDREGRPVSGATVGERSGRSTLGGGNDQWRTGADGRIRRFFELGPGRSFPGHGIVVRAPGFAPQALDVTPTPDDAPEVHVVLGPARRVAGRVLRADGRPQAGASVTVANGAVSPKDAFPRMLNWPDGRADLPPFVTHGFAATAEDGSFAVEDLPEGPYRLQASHSVGGPGVQTSAPPVEARLDDVPSDATGLVLTLPPWAGPVGAPLEGLVTDARTGRLLPAFLAILQRGPARIAARPSAPGRFRMEFIPEGSWTLLITAEEYLPFEQTVVEVRAAAKSEPLLARLEPGCVVSGSVRALSGVSLAGRRIQFVAIDTDPRRPRMPGPLPGGSPQAFLAADGGYLVKGLVPGRYRVQVVGSTDQEAVLVPDSGEPITLAAGAAEARVDVAVTPAGRLCVEQDPRALARPRPFRLTVLDAGGRTVAEETGTAWTFGLCYELRPGTYLVRFGLEGAPPREQGVAVTAGGRARAAFPVD